MRLKGDETIVQIPITGTPSSRRPGTLPNQSESHMVSLYPTPFPRISPIAEGVYAQKAIDEIGDPDQAKNGYPLQSNCERMSTPPPSCLLDGVM